MKQTCWTYGEVVCAAYPLESIDTITYNGSIDYKSVLFIVVFGVGVFGELLLLLFLFYFYYHSFITTFPQISPYFTKPHYISPYLSISYHTSSHFTKLHHIPPHLTVFHHFLPHFTTPQDKAEHLNLMDGVVENLLEEKYNTFAKREWVVLFERVLMIQIFKNNFVKMNLIYFVKNKFNLFCKN